MERLLSWEDVAERLQVGEKKARQVMTEMRCVTVGRKKRVSEKNLAAWIAANETPPDAGLRPLPKRTTRGIVFDWREGMGLKEGSA